ncbi:hypothetical protein CHELA1G11_12973 [Hyphomicrobiales bacterium]|nr:hypothetical protein CHELA1G2_11337 [Hyphomicrobiales bacterium]CAH1668418.1 hypothetical protein CHELA1G11_12973 [Hyphomicrobiales bacterium]
MSVRPSDLTYPCYYMYKDTRGEWRWVYYAKNGEEIAVSSEGYIKKSGCAESIGIMQISGDDTVFEQSPRRV